MLYGILISLIAGVIVAFSLQNASTVPVLFLGWQFEMSLVSLVVFAVLTGIVLAQLLRRWSTRNQERDYSEKIPNRRR